jgi:hypothetical protein
MAVAAAAYAASIVIFRIRAELAAKRVDALQFAQAQMGED